MSVRVRCILEQAIPGIPRMEGKSLAVAYCADPGPVLTEDDEAVPEIILIDFGSGKSQPVQDAAPSPAEPLFAPLDPFVANGQGVAWRDAASGLEAVRKILGKLGNGASVSIWDDFPFRGDIDEPTEGVQFDLETLEEILKTAQNTGTRFHLAFDV